MSETGFKVVVFDWDGTLIDSTSAIVAAIRGAAADLGLEVPSHEQASHVIGLGLRDAIRTAVPTISDDQEDAFIDRYKVHFFQRDPHLQPFEGIVEVLDALAKTSSWLAVATGKSRVGLDRALRQTGWKDRFVTSRCADEGSPKPAPWMLQDICAELGVATSQALMIGDTTHDLGMARRAGSAAIGVSYGAHPRSALGGEPALVLVDTVAQLRAEVLARV